MTKRERATVDRKEWAECIQRVYEARWKARKNTDKSRLSNLEKLTDMLKTHRIHITQEMLVGAEYALRKWAMKDSDGLAPQAILAVATVARTANGEKRSFFFQAIELAINERTPRRRSVGQ